VKNATILIAVIVLAAPVLGHHSDAGIDMNSSIILEGTVTEFHFRNPHAYFLMEASDEDGELAEWSLQMGSALGLSRRGWSRDTLVVGDRVRVEAHPAVGGRPYGIVQGVETPREIIAAAGIYQPDQTASATSLEGTWLSRASEQVAYPGGIDGFFLAQLELSEKGQAARDAYDPLSPENPEAQCIGRPSPGMIVSSTRYPVQIQFNEADDTVIIRSQYWDEVRTVYMDGREHPNASVRFLPGHSIGHWEEDTLVVDTTNFLDHRSPYQIGVPSGGQKHVVERYRLIEDGARIAVEFMLEDPEYLVGQMTHSRELVYSPHVQMAPFNCDPEATRRFLAPIN